MLTLSEPESRVSRTVIGRKLQDIYRDLALLGEHGKVKGFFNNVNNADKLSGLAEDIRDAMMDYQVCALNAPFFPCVIFLLDIIATRCVLQELPTHRESHLITLRPYRLTDG